jgi:hypothetical protein
MFQDGVFVGKFHAFVIFNRKGHMVKLLPHIVSDN